MPIEAGVPGCPEAKCFCIKQPCPLNFYRGCTEPSCGHNFKIFVCVCTYVCHECICIVILINERQPLRNINVV